MRSVPAIALLFCLAIALPCISRAEEPLPYHITPIHDILPSAPEGSVGIDPDTGEITGTNILIQHGNATLMADSIRLNRDAGTAIAQGHVRVEQAGQIWVGDSITYNFNTHMLGTDQFKTGRSPVIGAGDHVQANVTNHTYAVQNMIATTDNVKHPAYYLHAARMTIVPGKYIEAWNAVLYVEGVPIFYYPYYRRNLSPHANTFLVMPGGDSSYGAFLYGTYSWWLNDDVDGKIHLDYRTKRGFGGGPDLNLNLQRWGNASIKYYYLDDLDPNESINNNNTNYTKLGPIPKDRQRLNFQWQATPYTNLNVKALVNYQSDQLVLHDFFQSEYAENPQPNTVVEVNKYLDNWSLDAVTTPRINSFFDQVERLPDVQLTGLRQQIFNTPVYYESQNSVGYYQRYFAGTNTLFGATNNTMPNFNASRADTFQQLLLPETFFGWLNVMPRVGGRVTWYGPETGPGGTNTTATRYVFNTGVDVSFTASHLWPDAHSSALDVDGLRHIIVPSLSYAFVPTPNVSAPQVPQFDTLFPSLLILPIQFPDYNNIDAIEQENVIRWGIRNTLQTKRNGQLDNLLDWNVMLDWNLHPNGQTNAVFMQPEQTFNDLYSDLAFKPRSWIIFQSQIRYSINNNYVNMAFNQVAFTPNDRWSLGLGQWYLRNGFVDSGDSIFSGSLYYRLSENWGLHTSEYFNARTGRLQQQFYSLTRDMRSWTVAATFRVIDNGGGQPVDYGFAVSISLKALPRYHVGDDTVRPYTLLGQ